MCVVHTGKERGRKNDEVCVCVFRPTCEKRKHNRMCMHACVCVVYGRVRDRGELCVCAWCERDRRREREGEMEGEGERARGELCVCERG